MGSPDPRNGQRELIVTNFDQADIQALRDYAEKVRELHYWVATHEKGSISNYMSVPYMSTKKALRGAIAAGWFALAPSDIDDVMDTWNDCNESIAYCVDIVVEAMIERANEWREQQDMPELTFYQRNEVRLSRGTPVRSAPGPTEIDTPN